MPVRVYEYRGLMAEYWDLLRGDTSGWADRFFYLDVVRQFGQPVLDVGCGTGRILLDYLSHGIDIDGVGSSPEMLAICRNKAADMGSDARLFEQEMEVLRLPRRFRTILVPSSSLQLVIAPDAARRAMVRLAAHLLPGGAIAASFMTLCSDGDPLQSHCEHSAARADGAIVKRVSASRYDPACECESTEDLYQVLSDGAVIAAERHARSPATRSYTQDQALSLFKSAGLTDIRAYSGFTWKPVRSEDRLFTLLGRMPDDV